MYSVFDLNFIPSWFYLGCYLWWSGWATRRPGGGSMPRTSSTLPTTPPSSTCRLSPSELMTLIFRWWRCGKIKTKRRLYENFTRRGGDWAQGINYVHYCPGTSLSWHRSTLMERFRPRTSRRFSTWPSLRGNRIRWQVTISNSIWSLHFTFCLGGPIGRKAEECREDRRDNSYVTI